ncbi:MAG: penicillin-binding protein 1C, partial [Endomicrobia bacterium]|nr:penicillin-binding protein 1C [Endomicrobiia bacterium]
RIAWKTGTSYGSRDAWAVGVTPRYVVGVWVGNASGEGRPGLTGVGNAAPVLFDIFSLLPAIRWFTEPYEDMEAMAVCRESGYKASEICPHPDTLYMPRAGAETAICPFHKLIHLSSDGRWRVDSSCESVGNMVTESRFVLPPAQEYYWRNYNIDYRPLPPLKPGCRQTDGHSIELIYPEQGAVLFLPRGFDGQQKFIFQAAHVRPDATIYWHVDEEFIGKTSGEHRLSCVVLPGKHLLTLTDERGESRRVGFEVK